MKSIRYSLIACLVLFAALPSEAKTAAESLFDTWLSALEGLQVVRHGYPELDGGVLCPACAGMHGRTGDVVWPLCWQWQRTGDAKHLEFAKRLLRWTRRNFSHQDGSNNNDVNSAWRGITTFSQTSLGRVLVRWGDKLDAETKAEWTEMFRVQSDWCMRWMDNPKLIVNVNYRAGHALAMEFAYRILKDEKYRISGDAQAKRVLGYIAEDGLLYGEAIPLEYISPRGFRGVDIGYNVEETLPALLEWAELRGDKDALEKFLDCAEAHLWFMLPDGGIDNSFGSRGSKWSYWGSRTSDGILPMLMIMKQHGRKGAATAIARTLKLYQRCTTKQGLLAGGLNYEESGEPTCLHHTFCHLKTLPQFIEAKLDEANDGSLPADGPFGLKGFPTVGASLAGVGPWRATFSEGDVYLSGDNGKSTGGGSLTFLYHKDIGPIFAANMPVWSVLEHMNMQDPRKDDVARCLTPRLEDGKYLSVYDDKVKFAVSNQDVCVEAFAEGVLTDKKDGQMTMGNFTLDWKVSEKAVSASANCLSAATLVLPVLVESDSKVVVSQDGYEVTVSRKGAKVVLKSNKPVTQVLTQRPDGFAFSSQTGFLAAYLTVPVKPGQDTKVDISIVW